MQEYDTKVARVKLQKFAFKGVCPAQATIQTRYSNTRGRRVDPKLPLRCQGESPAMDWRPVLGVALSAGSIPALVTPITAEQMDGLNLSDPLVC